MKLSGEPWLGGLEPDEMSSMLSLVGLQELEHLTMLECAKRSMPSVTDDGGCVGVAGDHKFYVVVANELYPCGNANADDSGAPAAKRAKTAINSNHTTGIVYHYSGLSSTPMEDGIIKAPFDQEVNLKANLSNNVVRGVQVVVHNVRIDS